MRRLPIVGALAALAVFFAVGGAVASTPGGDVRLTNDCHPLAGCGAGYVSAYTLATGNAYTDPTLEECTIARGRQNEPAVAVDPRNTSVLIGSSNDYCGVYNQRHRRGSRSGRSGSATTARENGGASFDELARAGLSGRHLAVRGARAGPHRERRRPGDRVGRPRPRVLRAPRARTTRPARKKTFGDVWVARFDNPGGAGRGRYDQRRQASSSARRSWPRARRRRTCSASSTTRRDRGRPHGRRVRRQRLLRLVALHRQRRERDLLRPARPTTARPGRSPMKL